MFLLHKKTIARFMIPLICLQSYSMLAMSEQKTIAEQHTAENFDITLCLSSCIVSKERTKQVTILKQLFGDNCLGQLEAKEDLDPDMYHVFSETLKSNKEQTKFIQLLELEAKTNYRHISTHTIEKNMSLLDALKTLKDIRTSFSTGIRMTKGSRIIISTSGDRLLDLNFNT